MRALAAADLVELAEAGQGRGPSFLALGILGRADPGIDAAALTLGQRDAMLLAVRAQLCGPHLDFVSECPACGTMLEMTLRAEEIGLDLAAQPAPQTRQIRAGGVVIAVAPLTAGALAAAEQLDDPDSARRLLLKAAAPDAPEEETALAAVEAAVEAMDPGVDTGLDWSCPTCAARWSEAVDVAALLASEITVRSHAVLADVAVLARAFHWPERDILALPAERRRFYLDAVQP
ncbi:MAG: hypothetical protein J0H11_16965 [Rhizobiales bacterium]|uniref:hypothetical protein n=1 Tax=uncultured Devosia sp. TaxID=211434 RepID=UPI001ACEC4DA|nr:hypothetical protein [uncultured Devosia sp.]MBN9019106.1 hypothetical protein [Hyphomicrobiales bacterium]